MKGTTKNGQHPKAEGYGQGAAGPKHQKYTRTEQDGENRLLTESEFMNRERLKGNE